MPWESGVLDALGVPLGFGATVGVGVELDVGVGEGNGLGLGDGSLVGPRGPDQQRRCGGGWNGCLERRTAHDRAAGLGDEACGVPGEEALHGQGDLAPGITDEVGHGRAGELRLELRCIVQEAKAGVRNALAPVAQADQRPDDLTEGVPFPA